MLIEPLSRDHDRKGFDCLEESVNRFLHEKAMQDQKLDLSRTMVLIDENTNPRRIIGYHTLVVSQVKQEEIPDDRPKITRNIPVILLGQIGVDKNFHGRAFGNRLVIDVQQRVAEIAQKVGVRALMLDARTKRLAEWYEKHDFVRLPDTFRMFKSVEAIRRLLE